MKHIIKFFTIYFLLISLTGFLENPDNKKTTNSPTAGFEYFPFITERTLIYNSNFGETKSTVTQKDNNYTISNKSDDFNYVQSFLTMDDGIYITSTEHYLHVFLFISSENKIRYSEPALRIPFPLDNESQWSWKGVEYYEDNDSSNISISGKFIGTETLTTEAGKFECIRIEITIESESGSSSVVNEWLAPNIGLVKLHAELDGTGLIGTMQSILGYDEIYFELKDIL